MKLFSSLDPIKNQKINNDNFAPCNFLQDWNEYANRLIKDPSLFDYDYFNFNIETIIKEVRKPTLIDLAEAIVKDSKCAIEIGARAKIMTESMVRFCNTGLHEALLKTDLIKKEYITRSYELNSMQLLITNILEDEYQAALFVTGTNRMNNLSYYKYDDNVKFLCEFIEDYEKELSIKDIITMILTCNIYVSNTLIYVLKQKEKDTVNARRLTSAIVSILASLSTPQLDYVFKKMKYQYEIDYDNMYRFKIYDKNSYEKEETWSRIINVFKRLEFLSSNLQYPWRFDK